MSMFDEVERARESSEHLAYDAYVDDAYVDGFSGTVCACGHDYEDHDEECGVCEIRRCPCVSFHRSGDGPLPKG